MKIKMMTFVSTLTLILATSVSAQVISILPGGRGNPYIGTPTTVPNSMSNIVISPRINLPAPLLAPSVAPTLSPVPMAAAISIMPTPRIMPIMPIRYSAHRVQLAASTKDVVAAPEKRDDIFDGRKQPDGKNASDDLDPVRSDRRQSLPENDLEKEIGAY